MATSESPCLPQKSRKPLSERREINLAIIPISYEEWNTPYNCSADIVLVFEEEEQKGGQEYTSLPPSPPPSPSPSLLSESHVVEIMDGLYIALVDDEADVSSLLTHDDEPFTHVVQLSYKTSDPSDPQPEPRWSEEEPRTASVQRLKLICPSEYLVLSQTQSAVGYKELHAARDFLSLALPHGRDKWWPEQLRRDGAEPREQGARSVENKKDQDDDEEGEDVQVAHLAPDLGIDEYDVLTDRNDHDEEDVNALIVAPTRRAVDVLSVLFCYLAFLEDSTPDRVADMKYFDQVWDNVTLERWSMLYIELIARGEWLDVP